MRDRGRGGVEAARDAERPREVHHAAERQQGQPDRAAPGGPRRSDQRGRDLAISQTPPVGTPSVTSPCSRTSRTSASRRWWRGVAGDWLALPILNRYVTKSSVRA